MRLDVDLASCTAEAVVCDDTGTTSALTWAAVASWAVVVLVLLALAAVLVRRSRRRVRRVPVRHVRVDRWGNVVETRPPA